MTKFQKIVSICMVGIMGLAGVSCTSGKGDEGGNPQGGVAGLESQQLQVLKSDAKLTPEQQLSRIKADYLIQNNGYSDDDEVVAILSLDDDALIDTYLRGDRAVSLGEYAATPEGKAEKRDISLTQEVLIRDLQAQNLIKKVDYTYTTVLNAVAVTTTYKNFLALENYAGTSSVVLSDTFNRPQETDVDASAIVNAVDVYETGIFNSGVVEDKGITGKGTSVAVLDSGFDLSHQVFDFTPEAPEGGELMFDSAEISSILPTLNASKTTSGLKVTDVYYSEKIPYSYDYADKDADVFPYDSEHGTHVAGIIGGYCEEGYTDKDGKPVTDEEGKRIPFRGVAKDTQLVLMKVFPNLSEGAETEDILAALEDAVTLKVDCINMSLGASCGFVREADGDPINTVYDKITQSGVSLITAASNSYSSGFGGEQGNTNFVTNPDSGTVGSPSTYEAAVSVASISGTKSEYIVANGEQVVFFDESNNMAGLPNDFFGELYSDIETNGSRYGFDETEYPNRYNGITPAADSTLTLEYVTVPGDGLRSDYRHLTDEYSVVGKIALVRRGNSTFEDKALQAKNAGAIGCIIYNNIEGDILMSMGKSDHIPTVSISREDGEQMAKLRKGAIVISTKQQAGPFMSDFSSWGPLPDLSLKPEITAHGGNITSSVPGGKFDEISGTSMACPNLCGMMVLVRQFLKDQARYEDYSWKEISTLANQMLMSTASIVLNEEGIPYSPRKQGAGLANLGALVAAEAYLTVDGSDRTKLELKDDPDRRGVYEMDFNIVNVTDAAQTYEISLFGMTESVSASDNEHVAETGSELDGKCVFSVTEGGSYAGGLVTVNAGATAKVHAVYTLTQGDKDMIDDLFPYGMYVEGFVKLTHTGNTQIDLNVPFLAFYGDWTKAPIFDKTYYEVESEAHDLSIDEDDKLKADYYATTPYGSYLYNYIIALGTYLYDVDLNLYDAIPATEAHAAMSDTLGCIDGISAVAAGLLRNCKNIRFTVTDKASGEVVWTYDAPNMRKAFSQGGGPIPNYEMLRFNAAQQGLVNNRQYTFNMVGSLDYKRGDEAATGADTNVRNNFSFDFYLDNEEPVIKATKFEKEYDKSQRKDRYYLTLTVCDNRYAMSVAPFLFTQDLASARVIDPAYLTENPIPVYGDAGEDCLVRFEVTDMLKDVKFDETMSIGFGFIVDDYALNQGIYYCRFPGTDLGMDENTPNTLRFTRHGGANDLPMPSLWFDPYVGEVVDLTDYLYTADPSVDADKDYLKHFVWISSDETAVSVQEGQILIKKAGVTVQITVIDPFTGATAYISVYGLPRPSAAGTSATIGSKGARGKVVPISQNDVPNVDQAELEELRFAYFDTVFAHARAGQVAGLDTSNIGETGSRTFLSSLPGGISCYPGESVHLYYDLQPWYIADRYAGHLVFASTNPAVAEVDQSGIVNAKREGSTTITLRAMEGDTPSPIMASVRVTVNSEFVIDDARTLVAYKGLGGEVVIPDDEGILYIGSFAFSLYTTDYNYGQELPEDDQDANKTAQANATVTSVVVPEGVQEIQRYAFYHCTELESVTLPSSIRFVREYAFDGDVKLASINLEDVEAIGACAFRNCELLGMDDLGEKVVGAETRKTLNLNGVYAMGNNAFEGCDSLEYLDLTALRNTGNEVFMNCTSLEEVKFEQNGRTKLSAGMFAGSGLKSLDLYEKKTIPDNCFNGCTSLQTVVMHNGLISIGETAFAGCETLSEVTLPDSEFALSSGAFAECAMLQTLHFQQRTQLTSAASQAFAGSNITVFTVDGNALYTVGEGGKLLLADGGKTIVFAVPTYDGEVTLGGEYTKIASGAFSGTKIVSVVITAPLTRIDDYAFADCTALTSVTLPDSATLAIGRRAFGGCTALTEVGGLEKITHVEEYAFVGAGLESATIAENAEYGEGVFLRSSLKTVTIGKNAKIGAGVFQRCTSLKTVCMPAEGGVTFGEMCFSGDTALTDIDLKTVGKIEAETFYGCTALKTVDLSNVTEIGDIAFANCSSLDTVTLKKVEKIGAYAFARNGENGSGAAFAALELPETLTEIGESAFFGCGALRSIVIPSKVTKIPEAAFAFCLMLEEVTLPAGLDTVEGYAFIACANLTDINLEHVKHIGDGAFLSEYVYASLLGLSTGTTITINQLETIDLSSAEDIGLAAFAGNLVKGDFTLPNLVTLGDYAFYKVNRSNYNGTFFETVKSFDAPNLTRIGDSAFEGNASMTTFKIYPSVEYIGPMAFLGCSALTSFVNENGGRDGEINSTIVLYDGNLYTKTGSGKLVFASYPAGRTETSLVVKEGTFRVESYAGNENTSLNTVVLPDSLETVGDHAFYGCTSLRQVEFRSVAAPKLETVMNSSIAYQLGVGLDVGDPGYDILHNQIGFLANEALYFNFVDLVGKRAPIQMVLPQNADITGYDNVIYLVYFGPVDEATRSTYVAMEASMKSFLNYARQVARIEKVTTADETLIQNAVAALNAVKQDPAEHGVDMTEWNGLREKVLSAQETLNRIKVANAKREVRLVQEILDALPDRYDGTAECKQKLDAATAAIESLNLDDRAILIRDRYNRLLASYNESLEPPVEPQNPAETEGDKGCGSAIGVGAAALVFAAACAAALSKRKNG